MTYLYGDSTRFPLNENFIETLRSATDACLALLQADEAIDQIRKQMDQEKEGAERDMAGVERLSATLRQAMAPHQDSFDSPYVSDVFNRVMGTARSVFEGASRDLVGRRDSMLLQTESRLAAERARIPHAIERFLLHHQMPDTQWSLNWLTRGGSAQGQAQAHGWALAKTPQGLEVTFELELGSSPLWSRPFRVGDIKPDSTIQMPHKGGWLDRGAQMREERLDRYYVTEVSLTPARAAMVLRRSLKPGSPGVEVTVGGANEPGVRVRMLDESGASDQPMALEGRDAAVLADLWESISTRFAPLVRSRARLVQALLEGSPLADVQSPGRVARLMIGGIAPFVREMGRRSSVAGELVLKREVEDGRREELFISIRELTDKFAALSPDRQSFFQDFGLVYDIAGDGDDQTAATMELKARRGLTGPVTPLAAQSGQYPAVDAAKTPGTSPGTGPAVSSSARPTEPVRPTQKQDG